MIGSMGTISTPGHTPRYRANPVAAMILAAGILGAQVAPLVPYADQRYTEQFHRALAPHDILDMPLVAGLRLAGNLRAAEGFLLDHDQRTVRAYFNDCFRDNIAEADLQVGAFTRMRKEARPIDDVGRAILRLPENKLSQLEKAEVVARLCGISIDDVVDSEPLRFHTLHQERDLRRIACEQRGRWERHPLIFLGAIGVMGTVTRTSAATGMAPTLVVGTCERSGLTLGAGTEPLNTTVRWRYRVDGAAADSTNNVAITDPRDAAARSSLSDQRGTTGIFLGRQAGSAVPQASFRNIEGLWSAWAGGTAVTISASTRAQVTLTNAAGFATWTPASNVELIIDDSGGAVTLAALNLSGVSNVWVHSHDASAAATTTAANIVVFNHSSALIVERLTLTQTGAQTGSVWLTGGVAANCALVDCGLVGAWDNLILYAGATGRTNCGAMNCTSSGTPVDQYSMYVGGIGTGIFAWGCSWQASGQDTNGYTIRVDGSGGGDKTHISLQYTLFSSDTDANAHFRAEVISSFDVVGCVIGTSGQLESIRIGDIDGTGGYSDNWLWGCHTIVYQMDFFGGVAGIATHGCWLTANTQACVNYQNNGGGDVTNHVADHTTFEQLADDFYMVIDDGCCPSSVFTSCMFTQPTTPQIDTIVFVGGWESHFIRSCLFEATADDFVDGGNFAALAAHANAGATNTRGTVGVTSATDPTPTGNGNTAGNPQTAAFNSPYNDINGSWYVAGATTTAYRGCWQLIPTAHSSLVATPGDAEVELAYTEGGASNNGWARYGTPSTALGSTAATTTGSPWTIGSLVNDSEYGIEIHNFNATSGLSAPTALATFTPEASGGGGGVNDITGRYLLIIKRLA